MENLLQAPWGLAVGEIVEPSWTWNWEQKASLRQTMESHADAFLLSFMRWKISNLDRAGAEKRENLEDLREFMRAENVFHS